MSHPVSHSSVLPKSLAKPRRKSSWWSRNRLTVFRYLSYLCAIVASFCLVLTIQGAYPSYPSRPNVCSDQHTAPASCYGEVL